MEKSSECVDAKTPRRTRRSSATELGSVSKAVRSAKTVKMPEIEEAVDAPSDPKTPSRSARPLEFRTPSKSEAMTLAQTPRRSARKSIKPVQEYENIVAQKGLKRAASSTQDEEEPAVESKWIPAVIGRGTTKRGKKAGRGKGKSIKRQRRFTDDSEDNEDEHCETKENDMGSHQDDLPSAIIEEQVPNAIDTAAEVKKDLDCEPSVINTEELLGEQKIEMKQEAQSEELSEKKKIATKEILISLESSGGKESLHSEHDAEHDSRSGTDGDIVSAEEVPSKIEVDQDSSQEEQPQNENVSAKSSENEDNQLKTPSTEETVSKDVSERVAKKESPNVEQTNMECELKSVQDVTQEEPSHEEEIVQQVEVDVAVDSPETVSAKPNENADTEEKSPSMEEAASKDENEKQITNTEETNLECDSKSVEDVTEEEPNHKEEDHQDAVEAIVDSSDNSMESGDVELAAIPVTADDSMDSPIKENEKEPQPQVDDESSNQKSLNDSVDENLDDSDCIMLSLDESSNTVKSETVSEEPARELKVLNESTNSSNMSSLMVCSDDEEEPMGKSAEKKDNEAEKVQQADESKRLNGTFDAEDKSPAKVTVQGQETQILRPSISHVPTPFKSKALIIPDIIIEPEEDLKTDEPPTVMEQSRATRIKSSRKRSFSVCGDRPKRNVTFYSPANTTVSIYDGDLLNSFRKEDSSKEKKHRKRSLSVTETEKEMIAYIKQKKVPDTPESKKKQPLPASRIKMPNFSAIHQHQFKKMESISDHVARKAERAKILSNSALKAKPTSILKGLPVKNSVLRDCNKDSKTNLPMPKARQRIDLFGIEHKPKAEPTGWLNVSMKMRMKSRNDLSALDDLASIDKLYKFSANNLSSTVAKPKLPKPRMDATLNSLSKTLPLAPKTAIPNTTAAKETIPNQTFKVDTRPDFNLSTAPECQSFRSTKTLNDRRKRLMEMYKSRSHPRAGEKNREILKGVRTNRRFELQMMCRNRPN